MNKKKFKKKKGYLFVSFVGREQREIMEGRDKKKRSPQGDGDGRLNFDLSIQ